MSKIKNMSGQIFGCLEVTKFEKLENNRTFWNCYCNPDLGGCGNTTFVVRSQSLKSGKTKSCGCNQYNIPIDKTSKIGVVVGYLRVIEYSSRRNNTNYWKCYCDPSLKGCGNYCEKSQNQLNNKKLISCGCARYYLDISNRKFGRLTAIEKQNSNHSRNILWRCICECGNEKVADSRSLVRGYTRSCGCLALESKRKIGLAKTKHGESNKSGNSLYRLWQYIKHITCHKNHPLYNPNLTICPSWENSYETFKQDLVSKPKDKTLQLKDGTTEYNKENCFWGEGIPSRRCEIFFTKDGETKSLIQWAETLNMKPCVLYKRKALGLSDEEILTKPVRVSALKVKPGDIFENIMVDSFSHKYKSDCGKNVNYWNCICNCGNKIKLKTAALKFIKSCGCLGLLNTRATKDLDKYRKAKREKLHNQLLNYIPNLDIEESNEKSFRYWLVLEIQSRFNIPVQQEIYIKRDSRIDIVIPTLKLGIEVKTSYTNWSSVEIEEQVNRYKYILQHPVLLVSPDGNWGMNPEQLFDYINNTFMERFMRFLHFGDLYTYCKNLIPNQHLLPKSQTGF